MRKGLWGFALTSALPSLPTVVALCATVRSSSSHPYRARADVSELLLILSGKRSSSSVSSWVLSLTSTVPDERWQRCSSNSSHLVGFFRVFANACFIHLGFEQPHHRYVFASFLSRTCYVGASAADPRHLVSLQARSRPDWQGRSSLLKASTSFDSSSAVSLLFYYYSISPEVS
jgi:hypothetical protein